jgi:hypothetical protein
MGRKEGKTMAKETKQEVKETKEVNNFRIALVLSGEQGERLIERIGKAGLLSWRKSANNIIEDLCKKAGI